MHIVIFLVLTIVITILIPIKISINYEYYSKDYDINDEDVKKEIKIYILRCIRIKKISKKKDEQKNENNKGNKLIYNLKSIINKYTQIKREEKIAEKSDINKISNSIYVQKLDLNVGFNTKGVILNAYINSFLNSLINNFLSNNITKINLKNTRYNTYTTNNLLRIKIQSIVDIKLANNIIVIFKLIYKIMKGGKNNGKETSNRKSNVNSYDFS